MLIITGIVIAFSAVIGKNYSEACDIYAKNGVKAKLTSLINSKAFEYLSSVYNDDDFTEIDKKSDGSVSNISINTIKLSMTANELSDKIYDILKNECPEFGIPFGNMTGFKSLSGKLFKVPVKIVPVGFVAYEIKSEFISGGINQTLHRVSLIFTVTVNCLTPFYDCSSVITVPVTAAETVINGNVPNIIWKK